MANFVVLGCGRIGSFIAQELSKLPNAHVAVCDVDFNEIHSRQMFSRDIEMVKADISWAPNLLQLATKADVIVSALPSHLGYSALEKLIVCGKPIVDISFMKEDPFELDDLAKLRNTPVIVDCGVSPGLSNILVEQAIRTTLAHTLTVYVGGIPKNPQPPFYYKAPFAPSDVIEVYLRPARVREDGRIVLKPPLSDPETINTPAGSLEARTTDGLRTLLKTTKIKNLSEKTLRPKGHFETMDMLIQGGFFSEDAIFETSEITPKEMTQAILFDTWKYEENEEEITVMRVCSEDTILYEIVDYYDSKNHHSSMARTTGFPACIVAELLSKNKIRQTGIIPPELLLNEDGFFDHFTTQLSRHGICLKSPPKQKNIKMV